MTGSDKTVSKPAPLWALALGVAVAATGAVFMVRLLAAQVQAFALAEPGAGNGAAERLLWPAAIGEVLLSLAVWGVLWLAFRTSWKRRRDQLYIWLAVLLAASLTTSTVVLIQSVKQVRVQAEQAAAAVERREIAAVERTIARFADEQDAELATDVLDEMKRWADPITDIRGMSIRRHARGDWEAACGQVSFGDGKWAGFVTHRIGAGRLVTALQQDGLDEAKQKVCRPVVDKYVGVEGVDVRAAMAAMKALGCSDLDIYYWDAEKTYCRSR